MTHPQGTSRSPSFARSGNAAGGSPSYLGVLEGMIDVLSSERRLLDELILIMRRQREAIAADDLQGVDDSVFSVQRVILTLNEARKRRRSLNQRLGSEEIALRDLETAFGAAATPALRDARDGLQQSARTLSVELGVNRRVLREALASSDGLVRALCGGGTDDKSLYTQAGGTHGAPASAAAALLVNRQV